MMRQVSLTDLERVANATPADAKQLVTGRWLQVLAAELRHWRGSGEPGPNAAILDIPPEAAL